MPTPFYHLSLAEDLLRHPTLAEPVPQFLFATRSEFLFGNTAPDVQVVSGQPRKVTHLFELPIKAGDPLAWEVMLKDYPGLADARQIPEHWAGFVGGSVPGES